MLGGRADEGDAAHHGDGVEARAGEQGGLHEEERTEEGSLGDVERGPESVFLDVAAQVVSTLLRNGEELGKDALIRVRGETAHHAPDTGGQTYAHYSPFLGQHRFSQKDPRLR